jgi:hypothetical protein
VAIDFDMLDMRVEASASRLIGNVTAAQLHCCVLPGANVGVASR